MEKEFREIVYRITNFTGPGSLSKLEDKLVELPGVKFVDFEFPVAVLRIDVDESVFKDSEVVESIRRMGLSILKRSDSTL